MALSTIKFFHVFTTISRRLYQRNYVFSRINAISHDTLAEDEAFEVLLDGPTVSASHPLITLRSSQSEVTAMHIRWLLHHVRRRCLITEDLSPRECFQ